MSTMTYSVQRSVSSLSTQTSRSSNFRNWNDLAASEDWSEEDWSGQLETKVFTASSSSGAPPAPPDTASIMQLLKEVPNSGGGEGPSSSAPPSQQQQAPTLSVAQFNQQATETIKAAVGVGSVRSTYAAPSSAVPSEPVALVPAGPKPVAVPPRTKTPRVRVPPPSKNWKITASAAGAGMEQRQCSDATYGARGQRCLILSKLGEGGDEQEEIISSGAPDASAL
ncbi:hypothetical protein HPB47_018148 [Ixodes persulcatus]|uniref:Uncharacterized protein n=1 Tax=Ixodes persulcatus TaxID=34615 RepID=A0AC60QMA6_IXOPE|nr:hypothetical protein HPB47_018148 [Ixodes persulcatus]